MADPAISALNSLLRSSTIDDHQEALALANAAIKASKTASPADLLTAQHTKVVALLKLDRFADALRTIDAGGAGLAAHCALERAYALYKAGELEQAEEARAAVPHGASAADEAPGGSSSLTRALRHVAAQVAYRQERFGAARDIYAALAAEPGGDRGDVRINALAAAAQLGWQGNAGADEAAATREDLQAFETAYNAACVSLGRGDFARAAVLLKRARDLCEASEELSEEERRAETLPIVIQQVYALTRLGKVEEAAALQRAVDASEVADGSTKAVAQSNALALQSQPNPYIAQRLAEAISTPSGNDRLFEFQARVMRRNKYITELRCQKFEGVKTTTSKLLSKGADGAPGTSPEIVSLGVLNAAAKAELQTGKDALRRILPLLDSRPDDVGLLLTIIQLYIQTKNPGPAISLLEAFFKRLETATTPDHADVRFAPGLVALAVALYRLQGRHAATRTELAKAAAHWQRSPTGAATSLLRAAGIELLRSPNRAHLATAGAAFARICDSDHTDRAATAGLVASFATTDFARVEPHLAALTPVDQLTKNIDAARLLQAGVASLPAPAHNPGSASSRKRGAAAAPDATAGSAAEPARKKRKRKLPKDLDPARKPDPERWLPLRDRSSYRPKGKKGKKRAAEATQGGVVRGDEETLELAGGAGLVKVEKAPVGGGPAGKKKKKGKK